MVTQFISIKYYNNLQYFWDRCQDLAMASRLWKRMSKVILSLERSVREHPGNQHTRSLLSAIGTHQWQLSREALQLGIACDWSPEDPELRALATALFSVPQTTKQSLESGFNHLKDHGRQSKANRMSPHTRYSYLCLNPFLASGGINGLQLQHADFMALAADKGALNEIQKLPMFTGVRNAELPESCPTASELQDFTQPNITKSNCAAQQHCSTTYI